MTTPPSETGFDRTLIFTLPHEDARGRVVRLGPVLDTVLSAHAYPPVAERLLAEALVLTALLGSTLKGSDSQLTIQAQTDNGAISLLVCDYLAGQVRGHLSFDAERLAAAGPEPTLFGLFGKGFLALTFDQGAGSERYQGVVPLEGATLAEAAERYFRQSEQLPSVVRIAIRHDADQGCIAGGVFVQRLAAGELGGDRLEVRADERDEEAVWQHVATLAETITPAELTDPALSLEALVWRLYHDESEVRVAYGPVLSRGCRCDPDYLASVLARFPAEDRADMANEDGVILVDCAFCSKQFAIDPDRVPVGH
jgi:molecular chaperone Hsp33